MMIKFFIHPDNLDTPPLPSFPFVSFAGHFIVGALAGIVAASGSLNASNEDGDAFGHRSSAFSRSPGSGHSTA